MGFLKYFGLFSALLFLSACSEQLLGKAINSATNSSSGACQISAASLKDRINALNAQTAAFSTLSNPIKFNIHDFADDNISALAVENNQQIILPAGTQIILTINRACALKNRQTLPDKNLYQQINTSPREDFMSEQSLNWVLQKATSTEELQKIAETTPCIIALSPNKKVDLLSTTTTSTEPNDPYFTNQSHLFAIGYNKVYSKLAANQANPENTVVVAVIDSGNDLKHPDIQGQFWQNPAEKNGKSAVDDDQNGFVDDLSGWNFGGSNNDVTDVFSYPHGEHVSGLIAAAENNGLGIVGPAATRAKIMTLNVISNHLPGYGGEDPLILMENALRYAADNGAKVINISMGRGGTSTTALAALTYAVNKGVFVAVAAGNDGKEIGPQYSFFPAVYGKDLAGMISVAATDSAATVNLNTKCSFSNYSTSYVEIAAPGCDTNATDKGLLSLSWMKDPNATFPYIYLAGTSMASPLVAAAAADVISYIKEKSGVAPSNALVKDILKKGSLKNPAMTSFVEDGNTLDLPTLITYIDKEILHLPDTCK